MNLTPEEIKEVRSTSLFAHLPDHKLSCLEPGRIIDVPVGTALATEGEVTGLFHIVIEGEVRITRTYERQTVLMRVGKAGTYFGEIPILLNIPSVANIRSSKPTRLFVLDEAGFWQMMTHCHAIAQEVFRAAATRMRNVEGYTQQREKLASLGTMAAGLAHELNNPAAAARRSAAHLAESADKAQSLLCRLSNSLCSDDWQYLLSSELQAVGKMAALPPLDHLARSDREQTVAEWLESKGVASAWELAPTFVTSGIDTALLQEIAGKLPPPAQSDALAWLEVRLGLKLLLRQIEQSTSRIAELVKAIKSYSYMDQAPVQEVDIHEGLESTLTMLGYKLKNVTLIRQFDLSIPRITGYGGELNQVWTNLIDNAIDAVKGEGRICIGTCRDADDVVVEIVDNGPGIPAEVQSHMFEPFFTTKSVGSGTGLGLVISNAIIANRHGGEIEFESQPGETRFKVRLHINPSTPVNSFK
ncbi:MAG TPA: ATP-binding protein [Verrucomicrobiae bacterium]|jgi:signal transduction histidine kinase|nr:ATP-binding protein [Verrucomicrobiae bacterium]